MPILYDDGFLYELAQNRVCTITGRLGSGKTRLAIELAVHFLSRGYKLVTNIRTVYADEMNVEHDKVVLILDEGGLWIRRATDAMKLAAYARKLNMILIFSGKKLPHADLCDLQIAVYVDFWRNFLLPFTLWRWEYFPGGGVRPYHGWLIQVAPWWYNSTYDTIDPGRPPEEIVSYAYERARRLFERYGYNLPGMEIQESLDSREFDRAAWRLEEAAKQISRKR